jgi:hypothetical protein
MRFGRYPPAPHDARRGPPLRSRFSGLWRQYHLLLRFGFSVSLAGQGEYFFLRSASGHGLFASLHHIHLWENVKCQDPLL